MNWVCCLIAFSSFCLWTLSENLHHDTYTCTHTHMSVCHVCIHTHVCSTHSVACEFIYSRVPSYYVPHQSISPTTTGCVCVAPVMHVQVHPWLYKFVLYVHCLHGSCTVCMSHVPFACPMHCLHGPCTVCMVHALCEIMLQLCC